MRGGANLFVKDVIPWAHFNSVIFSMVLVCWIFFGKK